jgi:hypothetical protein
MPMVEISANAFNYLKSLAEPFVDTPATVLDRLIADHARRGTGGEGGTAAPLTLAERFTASDVPEMRFTKIEQVEVEGLIADINKWNDLVEEVVKTCLNKGYDAEEVRRKLDANTVAGRQGDAGFRYIEDAKFSFQGLDAQRACEAAVRLAKSFGVSLKVRFRWRENPKALRPGASAMIAA